MAKGTMGLNDSSGYDTSWGSLWEGIAGTAKITGSNATLVVGIVTAVAVYLWIYRWRQRNTIGPKAWPFLGSYLELQANSHRLHDWMTSYIKMSPTATVSFNVLGILITLTGNPENVEFMLKTNFLNFPKGKHFRERLSDLLGNGIFVADGEVWRMHRKIASLEFSSRKLKDFSTAVYRGHALRLLQTLDVFATSQEQVDFQDLALRMTLDSICQIGFGVDSRSLSPALPDNVFGKAFDNGITMAQTRQFGLTWKVKRFLKVGTERKLLEEIEKVDKFSYGIIAQRRAEQQALDKAGKQWEMNDLLARFMLAKDDSGELLSDRVLRDAILNFVTAGRDTSAVTLTWFVYCLCRNPEVAEKCYEELRTVIGDTTPPCNETFEDFAKLLTYESLGNLHYLHAAVTETLRLYPAVPKDGKYAASDCVLPDGTFVRKGSTMTYYPYAMGRLTSLWGPDCEQFRPERWLENGIFQAESPFKFTAFQAGPRVCLGKDVSYVQMKITAALLLRFFEVHLVPDHPISYRVSLLLPLAFGLKVTLTRR